MLYMSSVCCRTPPAECIHTHIRFGCAHSHTHTQIPDQRARNHLLLACLLAVGRSMRWWWWWYNENAHDSSSRAYYNHKGVFTVLSATMFVLCEHTHTHMSTFSVCRTRTNCVYYTINDILRRIHKHRARLSPNWLTFGMQKKRKRHTIMGTHDAYYVDIPATLIRMGGAGIERN